MMVVENKIMMCLECKESIEHCFCSCPYCGDVMENCHCNHKNLKDPEKFSSRKHHSKLDVFEQVNELSVVNVKDDDWWRLEKWQIGRSRFS
jgi:hypothetical protein